jgi:hypothetical protein
MKKRYLALTAASLLLSTGLVLSGSPAHADHYESALFFCSGPYTQGMGTSDASSGMVYHESYNSGTYTLRGQWYNTARTTRTSYYHGAGWQTFSITTLGSLYNQSKGCHYIG